MYHHSCALVYCNVNNATYLFSVMDLFLELSPAEDSNESPHCSLDNNIAHILNLLDSPSEQPRSGDTVSDYNDDVPDTQPIRAQILKGTSIDCWSFST